MPSNLKIGLALGSGGVKGLTHIGVIKVLEKNHIPIDYIAGSSIGAVVGAYYAAHLDSAKLEQLVLKSDWRNVYYLFDPAFSGGLISGNRIQGLLKSWFDSTSFSDLKLPFVAVCTDLISGQEVDLNSGNLQLAVRASMSVPPIFRPVQYEKFLLVDGGLCNPLPDDVVKKMGANKVITVNLDSGKFSNGNGWSSEDRMSMTKISIRSLNVIRHHLAKNGRRHSDIVIEPEVPEIGLVGWNTFFNPKRAVALIRKGEEATEKALPAIKKMLKAS